MAMYNLTQLQQAETIQELFAYANASTQDAAVGMGVIAIFFVLMFALGKWEFTDRLLVSSWTVFLISLMFSFAELVNLFYPLGFLIIASLTALYVVMAKD